MLDERPANHKVAEELLNDALRHIKKYQHPTIEGEDTNALFFITSGVMHARRALLNNVIKDSDDQDLWKPYTDEEFDYVAKLGSDIVNMESHYRFMEGGEKEFPTALERRLRKEVYSVLKH